MTKLRIAALQYDIQWEDIEANWKQVDNLLATWDGDIDLIVLPEMFTTGFTMNNQPLAEPPEGPSLQWMISLAAGSGATVFGSLIIQEAGAYFNRAYFVYPTGQYIKYDKRHLFAHAKEDNFYTPGNDRVVVEYKGWTIMPQICYDLRFPVWSRNDLDYDLLIYVANWPKPRISQWSKLLMARAIENQAYVVGANRIGMDGYGMEYIGGTTIIDFGGEVVIERFESSQIVFAELDKDALNAYRRAYRFLADRDAFSLTDI